MMDAASAIRQRIRYANETSRKNESECNKTPAFMTWQKHQTVDKMKTIFVWLITLMFLGSGFAYAGPYTESAHGNTANGVNRTSTNEYCAGNCAHCHEQHASIGGSEPAPNSPAGPDAFLLFSDNYTDQTNCFCFDCHKGVGSHQSPAFYNYNYSYRASGDTSITCPDNILEAFSFINETGTSVSNCGFTYGTSHKLTDIQDFIAGRWGYTADSNPCIACHDPHRTKRDSHTFGSRGWPVSRPSGHANTSTWELWGDDPDEKMSAYPGTYQAPYRHSSTATYEPDGSTTQDGSNLTEYVTFCTDCHDNFNNINSDVLGRPLYKIDWAIEKHGRGAASDCAPRLLSPYQETQCGSYVLACTDCHEPHGSSNEYLLRTTVNGTAVSITATGVWYNFCSACHEVLFTAGTHHEGYSSTSTCNTDGCHYHGSNF
jgi:cytochrome c553